MSEGYYDNTVSCRECKSLLGYAPYMREDYLCPKCNERLGREEDSD